MKSLNTHEIATVLAECSNKALVTNVFTTYNAKEIINTLYNNTSNKYTIAVWLQLNHLDLYLMWCTYESNRTLGIQDTLPKVGDKLNLTLYPPPHPDLSKRIRFGKYIFEALVQLNKAELTTLLI